MLGAERARGGEDAFGVDGARSALYSLSAFGLAIENDCCESAGMIVADGFVSVSTAVDESVASQLV